LRSSRKSATVPSRINRTTRLAGQKNM
jgi:hypothetical protein